MSLVAAVSVRQSTSPKVDSFTIVQVKSLVKDSPELSWRFSTEVSAVNFLLLYSSAVSIVITTFLSFTDFNFIVDVTENVVQLYLYKML